MGGDVINNHAGFIWSVAELLRGVYKQSEYGRVILPLTVLRRLDCVLEPTKANVLELVEDLPVSLQNRDPLLEQAAGQSFFNTSRHTFATLLGDPDNVAGNLRHYIARFSESARDIVDKFNFDVQIDRLDDHNLLYLVVSKFADLDLSPETVSNLEMGYLYEELIRKFSELSNETAGEHFTPREVIRLMVNQLFVDDDELLTKPGVVKTLLDPACGTGGMLSAHYGLGVQVLGTVHRVAALHSRRARAATSWGQYLGRRGSALAHPHSSASSSMARAADATAL